MNNYDFDSEVIELLNYLKSSVETGRRSADLLPTNGGQDIAARHLQSSQQRPLNKSVNSSSNILNSERQADLILKQKSLVSYAKFLCNPNQSAYQYSKAHEDKDKQLIKVIITPKLEKHSGDKVFRKKKIVTVQTTSSNHESSIRNKNLYLVVTGRKREKLYEIKTASSAKFPKEYIEHNDIEEIYNSKQFNKNWNMERKRKKDKKKDEDGKKKEVHLNVGGHILENVSTEVDALNDVIKGVVSEKSKVRIFGRIGLTEDDKYVFNCHATVDDKPVSTTTTGDKVTGFLVSTNNGLADSITQTEYLNNTENVEQRNLNHRNRNRRDSQSTQVNFNNKSNYSQASCKPFLYTNDQAVECDCSSYPIINTGYHSNNIKGQNPLVVISVFPKLDNIVETVNTTQYVQTTTNSLIKEHNNKSNESFNKIKENKTIRSRSPSPRGLKAKEKTITKSSTTKSNIKSSFGFRKANRVQQNKKNSKIEHTSQYNPTEKKDVEKKHKPRSPITKSRTNISQRSRSKSPIVPPKSPRKKSPISSRNSPTKSPVAPRAKSPNIHKTEIKRSLAPRTFGDKSKTREGLLDKEINNQHLKLKKAPREHIQIHTIQHTNKLGGFNNTKEESTAKSTSKVSVNIDSNKEIYDVVICQDRYTTDLNVRKTVKEKQKRSLTEKNTPNGSKNHRPRSLSQIISNHDANPLATISPRLTLRDSLEISHRREDKVVKNTHTYKNSDKCSEEKQFASLKHYTGDECTICDPVKRDREIRKLLGVRGRLLNDQSDVSEAGDGPQPQHFYPNQCEGACVAGFALIKQSPFGGLDETTKSVKDKNCDHNAIIKQDKIGRNDCITVEDNYKHHNFKLNNKDNAKTDIEQSNNSSMIISSTQCEKVNPEQKHFQQRVNFNRNFQIFQVLEQLTEKKPILLTRKQYKKLIRTIHKSSSSKRISNRSFVSIGRIREKPKRDQRIQQKKEQPSCKIAPDTNYKETTVKQEHVETVVLFVKNARGRNDNMNLPKDPETHTPSKLGLRYSSVSKHVAFSATNLESAGTSNFIHRNMNSIETIFRGHKKSPTPNLGTSGCSLSEATSKSSSLYVKSGKPFLKRLISCLAMRTTRSPFKQIETAQSMIANNSIDSYHISTSLGAITMTSSIYDTTASFYSDHSIHPLSSKLKRGFLNSIRDFLSNKRT